MEKEVNLDINTSFHEVLRDIENIFWFYIFSNNVLADPNIQDLVKSKGVGAPYLLSMLDKYNKWVNLHIEIDYINNKYTSKLNVLNSSIVIGKIMAISTYELLLSSEYCDSIKNSEEFKFLRHVRNGAAHNNKFYFKNKKGEWTLKENEIIKWQNQEISRKLQDKTVFNDFISFSGIFLLANHFSEELKQIDKIIKT